MEKTRKKRIKKRFNLLEEYKKCWSYIRESKRYIYVIIGIFLFFILLGLFIPVPSAVYGKIIDYIKGILEQTKGMSLGQIIFFIIVNNLQSTFLGIFLGAVIGIFPVINTVLNGYILGVVSSMSINESGILSLWRLFPHGIFELPAVLISLGLGLKFGTFIFKKDRFGSFKNYLINSLRIFLLVVIPLLIIAGIIEGSLIVFVK